MGILKPPKFWVSIRDALTELANISAQKPIVVGFSGGLDSTVLLHALSQTPQLSPFLKAIYIHHGLQSQADDWQAFCDQFCKKYHIPFEAIAITLAKTSRQGIESIARKARYQALFNAMDSNSVLVTAHHQRDQAETCLLSLFRGAGVQGLAAMPVKKAIDFDGKTLHHIRPLLKVAYNDLKDYATHFQLDWVEDPSNQQTHFKRNYVRHEILPKIDQAWAKGQQNIALSAQLLSESVGLLDDLALLDLQNTKPNKLYLPLEDILGLAVSRQKNVFRYWFMHYLPIQINQMIYDWLLQQIHASSDALPLLKLSKGELRVYHKRVYYLDDIKAEYCLMLTVDTPTLLQMDAAYFQTEFSDALDNPPWIRSLRDEDAIDKKALKKWFKLQKIPPWDRRRWPMVEHLSRSVYPLGMNRLVLASE